MTSPPFRLFEWVMSAALISLGIHLALHPVLIAASRFYNLAFAISQTHLTILCIVVGLARMFTLATSGLWLPWCARIRALGSIVATTIWLQLGIALLLNPFGPPSPGVPLYFTLAMGELISIWRSRREANGH